MLKDNDFNVFQKWAKLEGINLDEPGVSWSMVQQWINHYENDKKQDAWNYRVALHKERMGQD